MIRGLGKAEPTRLWGLLPKARDINHAEAQAALHACHALLDFGYRGGVVLYTDSQQALRALLHGHRRAHLDRTRRMFRLILIEGLDVDLRWLPHEHPERNGMHWTAHTLASLAARKAT